MNSGSGNDMDFGAELAAFDADFAKAPADGGDGKIPDGKYQMRVQDASMTRAQTSGAPMLKLKLRVEGPTLVGRIVWRNSVIAADKIEYLKRDLSRLGLALAKLSDLPAQIGNVKGVLVEVTAKTNGEFQNYYIDKRVAEVGGGGAASGFDGGFGGGGGSRPAFADDSGVPF